MSQNSTTVRDSPSVIKPIGVCSSFSHFSSFSFSHLSNVLRDAVMAYKFIRYDWICHFLAFRGILIIINVNMVRFSLASRGEKNSNHRGTHELIEMYWPIQICVKFWQSVYDLMLVFQTFLRLEFRKVIIQTGTDWQ
jgi:hypothetical protein